MSWQLDLNHSEVQFRVRHLMVSWIRGSFEKFSGTVELDEENPANSVIDITIEAASINTRSADRDAHLRSADFLDADHYPTIKFDGKRVEVTGKETAKLHGDLTIRGVTKPVTMDVTFQGKVANPYAPVENYGFSAQTVINRTDWGLTWNGLLESGGVMVGEDVHIAIDVEVLKAVDQTTSA
jgi:polyisoprenoid-binding protein YceI